jgi:hypothetical protein
MNNASQIQITSSYDVSWSAERVDAYCPITVFHQLLANDGARFEHVRTEEVNWLLSTPAPIGFGQPSALVRP